MSDEQVIEKPTEELAVKETVKPRGKVQIVYRKNGMFTKPPAEGEQLSVEQIRTAVRDKLTKELDENGTTEMEQVLDAQLEIAKDTDIKRGTSSQKAAEFVFKAGGLLDKAPDEPTQPITVIFQPMELMVNVVSRYEDRHTEANHPSRPSFAEKELDFVDATVVSTNDAPGTPAPKSTSKPSGRTDGEYLLRTDGTRIGEPELLGDERGNL